jgi:DNA-directed RNA polymerase specialized sigma24 family protein
MAGNNDRPVAGIADESHEFFVRLERGEESAWQEFWAEFAEPLLCLARGRLDPLTRQKIGASDAVQSVCLTFHRRLREGKIQVDSWLSCWRLLHCLTIRRCHKYRAHFRTQKRRMDMELLQAAGESGSDAAIELAGREMSPDETYGMNEAVRLAFGHVTNARHRLVVLLHLEGREVPEISAEAGLSEYSVREILRKFEARLQDRLHD